MTLNRFLDFRVLALFTPAVIFLGLWVLALLKGKNKIISAVFCLFYMSMILWALSVGMTFLLQDKGLLRLWANIGYFAGMMIPANFLLMSFTLPRGEFTRGKLITFVFFLVFNLSLLKFYLLDQTVVLDVILTAEDISYRYGPLIKAWTVIFNLYFLIAFIRFAKLYKQETPQNRQSLNYIIIGFSHGFLCGGILNVFLPLFGNFRYSWLGPILTVPSVSAITYTLIQYRLIHIKVALARAGLLVAVYAFVLGTPLLILGGGRGFLESVFGAAWYLAPLLMMFGLATLGPSLYFFLKAQMDRRLRARQQRYQSHMRQAIARVNRMQTLPQLSRRVAIIMTWIAGIRSCEIYLRDPLSKGFRRMVCRGRVPEDQPDRVFLSEEDEKCLRENRLGLFREEAVSDARVSVPSPGRLTSLFERFGAEMILPCQMSDGLTGFILLGRRKDFQVYEPEDVTTLSVLAHQTAMAVQNIHAYEKQRQHQELLYRTATLAEMGVMADSMGHQIKNHLHKMMAVAGLEALKVEEAMDANTSSGNIREILSERLRVFEHIEDQGQTGGRMIDTLSRFSRLPRASFQEQSLGPVLDDAVDILSFKVDFSSIEIRREFPEDFPPLQLHPILSEAFVNLIDNASEAVRERAETVKSQGGNHHGLIRITGEKSGKNRVRINIHDNGCGFGKDIKEKIFQPFFTTRAGRDSGSGLGLFVVRRIIEEHRGRIEVHSAISRGTCFSIELPVRQSVDVWGESAADNRGGVYGTVADRG